MIISFTGMRPDKLGGYKLPNPIYNFVCQQTEKLLKELKPDKCISGAALGYDQYCMAICCRLKIPYIAAIPHIGQEKIWPESSQKIYHKLLKKAESIVIVSEGEYMAYKMQIRNQYMVDNSDKIICCWDGTNGGTANCIKYARSVKKEEDIYYIDPSLVIK